MKAKRHENRRLCSQPKLVYLFPFYIRGDGTPDERKRVEKHLEACAVCRRELRFFSDLQHVGEQIFGEESTTLARREAKPSGAR